MRPIYNEQQRAQLWTAYGQNPELYMRILAGQQAPPASPQASPAPPAQTPTWRPATLRSSAGGSRGGSNDTALINARRAMLSNLGYNPLRGPRATAAPPASYTTYTPGSGVGSWVASTRANDMNAMAQQGYQAARAHARRLNSSGMAGTAMGGGGGGGGYAGELAAAYQDALNRANQANEERYQDILGGYQDRFERNLGYLEGAGQQEAADIDEAYRQLQAKTHQDLVNRGLTSSTVAANLAAGNMRDRISDQGRLQERLRQQRLAVDAGLSGDTLQFMERRNDVGPDFNQLAQLANAAGTAGGGGGAIYPGTGVEVLPPQALGYQMPVWMPGFVGVTNSTRGQSPAARENMIARRTETVARRRSKSFGGRKAPMILDSYPSGSEIPVYA